MKYTKGPWVVGDYLNADGARFLSVWEAKYSTNKTPGTPITLVTPKGLETETDLANANLISSAPDLLQVVKYFIETVEFVGSQEDWPVGYSMAKEAYQKAIGNS